MRLLSLLGHAGSHNGSFCHQLRLLWNSTFGGGVRLYRSLRFGCFAWLGTHDRVERASENREVLGFALCLQLPCRAPWRWCGFPGSSCPAGTSGDAGCMTPTGPVPAPAWLCAKFCLPHYGLRRRHFLGREAPIGSDGTIRRRQRLVSMVADALFLAGPGPVDPRHCRRPRSAQPFGPDQRRQRACRPCFLRSVAGQRAAQPFSDQVGLKALLAPGCQVVTQAANGPLTR